MGPRDVEEGGQGRRERKRERERGWGEGGCERGIGGYRCR